MDQGARDFYLFDYTLTPIYNQHQEFGVDCFQKENRMKCLSMNSNSCAYLCKVVDWCETARSAVSSTPLTLSRKYTLEPNSEEPCPLLDYFISLLSLEFFRFLFFNYKSYQALSPHFLLIIVIIRHDGLPFSLLDADGWAG